MRAVKSQIAQTTPTLNAPLSVYARSIRIRPATCATHVAARRFRPKAGLTRPDYVRPLPATPNRSASIKQVPHTIVPKASCPRIGRIAKPLAQPLRHGQVLLRQHEESAAKQGGSMPFQAW